MSGVLVAADSPPEELVDAERSSLAFELARAEESMVGAPEESMVSKPNIVSVTNR